MRLGGCGSGMGEYGKGKGLGGEAMELWGMWWERSDRGREIRGMG